MVDNKNTDVRLVALETLVMLFETAKKEMEEGEEFHLDDYANLFNLDELLEKINQKNTKMELSTKRKFERIYQVLESDLSAEIDESFTGNFTQIKISSWSVFVQLEFFTELIGKGLVSHFARNPTFKTIFGAQSNLQFSSKRVLSKNKKNRKQHINKMRDIKNHNN